MYRVGINLEHIDPAYVGGVNTFARDLSFSLAKINKDYKIIFFSVILCVNYIRDPVAILFLIKTNLIKNIKLP